MKKIERLERRTCCVDSTAWWGKCGKHEQPAQKRKRKGERKNVPPESVAGQKKQVPERIRVEQEWGNVSL